MNLYSINIKYENNELNASVNFKFAVPDKGAFKNTILNKVLHDIARTIMSFSQEAYLGNVLDLLQADSKIRMENNELTLKYYDYNDNFQLRGKSWKLKSC